MKGWLCKCDLFLVALVFLSCVSPVYEHAKIEKGFHVAEGVSFSCGAGPFHGGSIDEFPKSAIYYGARLQLLSYYGFSSYFCLFLQGGCTAGIQYYEPAVVEKEGHLDLDLNLGVKLALAKGFAVKINTGLPSLLDFTFLEDINQRLTLSLGLRSLIPPVPFFWGGITWHIPLKETGPELHTFLGGGFAPVDLNQNYNIQFGIGIGD
jgi:hypothetical protein